ncbi:hypothetical protein GIB67_037068 [Kingdonia uniflora]|uniref:RING-type E3 ubiquitin transferase n=1 Tax=Kingdonia uniflora TaxID=39325 RepID=A0A7J7LHY7_9MAGN|nr:hypothetical protein GIB67_037068 [Kingdonia uniflora]
MEKELEVKLVSFVKLMKTIKEERGRLELARDEAITQATKLRILRVKAASSQAPQFLSDFSLLEIEETTHSFDQSLIIGGENGSVYKGFLLSTVVPIKMLQSNSLEGCSKFQVKVDISSRMRHPNLFPLIGACLKASTLVYDYLPNGSLEGRLMCKDDTPSLSWQTRMRISIEVCSTLILLHSSSLKSIIHGDLKPVTILLDENLTSKLSDFGPSRLSSKKDSKGTSTYMDHEFLKTRELTPSSDVNSFGSILLRLLTG